MFFIQGRLRAHSVSIIMLEGGDWPAKRLMRFFVERRPIIGKRGYNVGHRNSPRGVSHRHFELEGGTEGTCFGFVYGGTRNGAQFFDPDVEGRLAIGDVGNRPGGYGENRGQKKILFRL